MKPQLLLLLGTLFLFGCPKADPPPPEKTINAAEPAEPAKVVEPAKPAEPAKAAKPEKPEEPAKKTPAVDSALEWLSRHQTIIGQWSCSGFQAQCKKGKCSSPGSSEANSPGITGLALLAFVQAGHTLEKGEHSEVVKRAVKYLQAIQDPEGCLGPRTSFQYIYNHAIGAAALARAYDASGRPESLKGAAQKAADFLALARNPYFGWRYGIKPGDNDISVTAWAIHALHAANSAGLTIDRLAYDGATACLQKMTDPDYGRVGYTVRGSGPARPSELIDAFPAHLSESMTAAGLGIRLMIGEDSNSDVFKLGVKLLRGLPPKWEPAGGRDFYYWWWGAFALQQVQGAVWDEWRSALEGSLVKTQRTEGDEAGSWDPTSPWGKTGGRCYSTAINTLTLILYYKDSD